MSAVAPTDLLAASPVAETTRRRVDPLLAVCILVIGIVVLVAIFAPLISPYNPDQANILDANAGASSAHLLGTDSVGRDLLSRLTYGARLSLVGPALIVGAATTLGAALAITTAWIGGAFDAAVSRVLDILFAFPGLIFALLAVAMFGPGLWAPVIALAVAYLPYIARVLRSTALRERNLPYISALYVGGQSSWRICLGHILPNITPFVVVQGALSFGSALIDLSALSYLGLGIQPPTAEWGLMVSEGQSSILNGYPAESLFAGAAIVIVVVSF
ncbi:MAG: ABC transporter permease, partial [Solirubrobacteraceae bacterium]